MTHKTPTAKTKETQMEFKVGDKIKYYGAGTGATYGEIIAVSPKTALIRNEYGETIRLLKTKLNWD